MRLAAEDFHVVRALEEAGITVFATATPSSTLMRLEYPTDNPDERILTVADHRRVPSRRTRCGPSMPKRSSSARPFRGEMPIETIRELREKDAMISADAQGFIRVRHPDGRLEHLPWPEQEEVLASGRHPQGRCGRGRGHDRGSRIMKLAAKALAAQGPREIVITHRDGIVVLADGQILEAEFHAQSMLGRSGRGDTCVGSYVAARLEHPPEEAILWSAATTSLKVEVPGPIRRSYEEIVDLIEQKYKGAIHRFSRDSTGVASETAAS